MKIAEINAYDFGSTGNIMLNIAAVARERMIEVYTFSSSRGAKNTGAVNHCYIDRYIDYRPHMIFGMLSGREMSFSYSATRRLIRELRKIKPDIIHLHNTHGWYLNHEMFFRYIIKNKIKVIWTLHDCWTFTGRCPHFQITGCDRWKTGCHNCVYDKKQYPASYIFDRSKQQWRLKKRLFAAVEDMTLVTPSQWLADLVKQSYLKEYPVRVINNGIDLSIFKPTESDFRRRYGLDDRYIVLGAAASWGVRKGLDVFADMASRLPKKYQIVLVGLTREQRLSLPKNIVGIEKTHNRTELAEIYSAADVFANPTREDNFPTVNIESLACGTPVVTFQTGGSPEMLDESCGSVVDCENTDAMLGEIIRICEEKPYSQDACVKRAGKFDMNDKFLEYVNLYKEQSECNL